MRLWILLAPLVLAAPVYAQGNCSDGSTGVRIGVSRAEISLDGSQFEMCFAVEGDPAETLSYLSAVVVYNGTGLYPTYEHIPGSSAFPGPGYEVEANHCLGGPDLCPDFQLVIRRDPDEPPYLTFPVEPAEFICVRYDVRDPSEHAGVSTLDLYAEQGDGTLASICPLEDQASYNGPLPVELVSFHVKADGNDAHLTWATASETNNAGFEVAVQKGGGSWEAIGFVDGHVTTTEPQTYTFTATGLDPGTYSFRLKQVDFDGMFEYFYPMLPNSVEVAVGVTGTHLLSEAYPNPFNPQATFTFSAAQGQRVTATLYNALGQRVAVLFDGSVEADALQTVAIDGAGLASGLYVVRVEGERFADALRVTLLK